MCGDAHAVSGAGCVRSRIRVGVDKPRVCGLRASGVRGDAEAVSSTGCGTYMNSTVEIHSQVRRTSIMGPAEKIARNTVLADLDVWAYRAAPGFSPSGPVTPA